MQQKKLKRGFPGAIAAGVCAVGMAGGAAAQTAERSMFSFSGFGTLGIVHSNNDLADFTGSATFQPNGAGFTRSTSADVDSKLGLQMNVNLSEQWSGVVQLVSYQNYNNTYVPHVEWANVSYKPTPAITLRAGRFLWPILLRSETQNIGYGNPFVRNASELVANMPNTSNDGADITYRYETGAVVNATTLLAGNSKRQAAGRGIETGQNYFHVSDIRGISHVSERGDLKVHAAYFKMQYTVLYYDQKVPDVPYKSATLGFTYDPGNWFVTADFLKADDSAYGKATAYTSGGGVRFGSFAPYVTYSSLKQDSVGSTQFGTVGDKQSVAAAGIRWDFRANMAAKLQFEKLKTGPIALLFPSSSVNVQIPAYLGKPRVNVFSATLDFVF